MPYVPSIGKGDCARLMERQMTSTHISYELGGRVQIANAAAPIVIRWNAANPIEGIKAFARDERNGDYVRVYEVGPTEWVQNEPQAWSAGNFETKESARHFASKAYRWINRARG